MTEVLSLSALRSALVSPPPATRPWSEGYILGQLDETITGATLGTVHQYTSTSDVQATRKITGTRYLERVYAHGFMLL